MEPAAVPEVGRDRALVEFQDGDEEIACAHCEDSSFRPHRREIAGSSSADTSASPVREGAFFTTMAVRLPPGNAHLWSRTISRRTRLIRLRTTARPARFPTEIPTLPRDPPRKSR